MAILIDHNFGATSANSTPPLSAVPISGTVKVEVINSSGTIVATTTTTKTGTWVRPILVDAGRYKVRFTGDFYVIGRGTARYTKPTPIVDISITATNPVSTSKLNDIDDVTATPIAGHVLTGDGQKWVDKAPSAAGIVDLNSNQLIKGNKVFQSAVSLEGAVTLPTKNIVGAGHGSGLNADMLDGKHLSEIQTGGTPTLIAGSSGNDFNIAGNTINIPTASATKRGLLTPADFIAFSSATASGTIDTVSPLTGGGDLSDDLSLSIAGLSSLGTANFLVGVNSDGSGWEYKELSEGTNVSITNDAGSIIISATGTGGATELGDLTDVANSVPPTGGNLLVGDGALWQSSSPDAAGIVTKAGTQSISGSKTFSSQLISSLATGTSPFAVDSTTVVTNLNADMVDGFHASSFIASDPTLVALAAYNTNGLLTQTAADTFTGRTITGTTNVISVSNGDGVAGNPTLTIDAAYVGQASITTLGTIGTGTWSASTIAVDRGGTGQTSYTNGQLLIGNTTGNTLTKASLSQPAAGLTITGGTGTITFALANDLAGVEGLSSTGFAVRTGSDTWTNRSITGSTVITVANGSGVAGNPAIDFDFSINNVWTGTNSFQNDFTINATNISIQGTTTNVLTGTSFSFNDGVTPAFANSTGTAPFTVASTTKVTNLNADTTDGFSLDQNVTTGGSPSFVRVTSTQATGTAPFTVASTTKVTNLNADTTDGFSLDQDVTTAGSPSFVRVTSTQATGTAPFTVASTTVVTNLNADLLDGKNTGTTGNVVPLMDGTNVWTGTNKINVNSTTAFFVEQDGVKDNVFIIDTTNARVSVNTTGLSGSDLHVLSKIAVNSNVAVYVPDQTSFANSIFFGNGGTSLSHGSGSEGFRNTGVGFTALNAVTTGMANTAVGYRALRDTASGTYNTGVGDNALVANTGSFNTSVGASALGSNIGGGSNTAIGYLASSANTTGSNNVAIGVQAMRLGSGSSYNVAVGTEALYSLATGTANFGMGYRCLYAHQTLNNSIGLGYSAGRGSGSNTTISGSIFIGTNAGVDILTGADNNVVIGTFAGRKMTTGDNNTFIGTGSGYYSTGASIKNTCIGSRSGYHITSGDGNILLGYNAGDAVTTGNNNIVIGYDIDAPSATTDNQLTIGNLIFATGMSSTGTTVSTGKVGIKTTAPDYALDINDAAGTCLKLIYNDSNGGSTNYSTFIVGSSGYLLMASSSNQFFIGSLSLDANNLTIGSGNSASNGSTASGYGCTASGYYSTASGRYSNASGYAATAWGSSSAAGSYSHAEGASTSAGGDYGGHSEGFGTSASGIYGSHAEGRSTTASGGSSHSQGWGSNARLIGQSAQASGFFAAAGDGQFTRFLLRGSTLVADGTSFVELALPSNFTLLDNTAYSCLVRISGRQSAGGNHAFYMRQLIIKRTSGTVALAGTVSTIGTDIETDGAWNVQLTADDTGKTLKIEVKGNSQDVRWIAVIEANEILYA